MSELFKNKYRVQSARLQDWDYSSNGAYFITIYTKNRKPYFGKILNREMKLSEIWVVVNHEWLKTGQIRTNVKLDEYIIMPDHFHGVIFINNFKSMVKRWCNENNHPDFQWQPSFYDHIIRNDESLYRIRKYIIENPIRHLNRNSPCTHIAPIIYLRKEKNAIVNPEASSL